MYLGRGTQQALGGEIERAWGSRRTFEDATEEEQDGQFNQAHGPNVNWPERILELQRKALEAFACLQVMSPYLLSRFWNPPLRLVNALQEHVFVLLDRNY